MKEAQTHESVEKKTMARRLKFIEICCLDIIEIESDLFLFFSESFQDFSEVSFVIQILILLFSWEVYAISQRFSYEIGFLSV